MPGIGPISPASDLGPIIDALVTAEEAPKTKADLRKLLSERAAARLSEPPRPDLPGGVPGNRSRITGALGDRGLFTTRMSRDPALLATGAVGTVAAAGIPRAATGLAGLALADSELAKNAVDASVPVGNDPRLAILKATRDGLARALKPVLAKKLGGYDFLTEVVSNAAAIALQSDPEMQAQMAGATEADTGRYVEAGAGSWIGKKFIGPIVKKLVKLAAKEEGAVAKTTVEEAVARVAAAAGKRSATEAAESAAKGAGGSLLKKALSGGAAMVGMGAAMTGGGMAIERLVNGSAPESIAADAPGVIPGLGGEGVSAAQELIRRNEALNPTELGDSRGWYKAVGDLFAPIDDDEFSGELARAILTNMAREAAMSRELDQRRRSQQDTSSIVGKYFSGIDADPAGQIPVAPGMTMPSDDHVRASRAVRHGVPWSPPVTEVK